MKRKDLFNQRGILMFIASLLTFCFAWVTSSYAQQPPDLQWYIWKGLGRNGLSAPRTLYSGTIGPIFQFENVTNPNRACHPKAKNDLFIIYADGTYFNSRENYNDASQAYDIDLFYPDDPSFITSTNQYYRYPNNKILKYLYMTSKYEEDDPPIGLRVSSPSNLPGNVPVYELRDTFSNALLTANHDVVENTDITLILSVKDLLALNLGDNEYFLRCDSLMDASNRENIPRFYSPLFDPIKVFDDNSIFPSGNLVTTEYPSAYKLETSLPENNYLFINIRPNAILNSYYPDGVNDNAKYIAVFELLRRPIGGGLEETPSPLLPVTTLTEAILRSHDPNFVRRDSICERDNKTYIYYHVEFENTTFVPADHLKVELIFPEGFIHSCIDISSWKVAGEEVSGNFYLRSDSIILLFPEYASCMTCAEGIDLENCKGSIDFCIRTTRSHEELMDPTLIIKPETYVSFDRVRYPLHKYIDPVFYDKADTIPPLGPVRTGFVNNCSCECSFICIFELPCIRKSIFYASITVTLAVILAGTLLFARGNRRLTA